MDVFSIAAASIGLTIAAVALVHAKVKISSVLIHHATHLKPQELGRVKRVVEALGIVALTAPYAEYRRVHVDVGHHKKMVFATLADEEARYLFDLGFRPGTPYRTLWLRFALTLVSPRWHLSESWKRLKMNLGGGWNKRTAAAWTFWGGLMLAMAGLGLLGGFVIGVVVPLLIGGNIGSFLELTSRHRWMIATGPEVNRHQELSHARLLGPVPPTDKPFSMRAWAAWALRTGAAIVARLTVIPGDLPWHIAHHLWVAKKEVPPAWVNSAEVYSAEVKNDHRLMEGAHGSILGAIRTWFTALSGEKKTDH